MTEKLTCEELECRIKELELAATKYKNNQCSILEAIHHGYWENNCRKNSFQFNNTIFTMLGYKPVTGREGYTLFMDKIHPEDKAHFELAQKNVMTGNSDSWKVTIRLKAADGSWHYILSFGNCIGRDDNGIGYHYIGTHTDITESKLTENALQESESRFKTLHNASFGGIAIHDKGTILECNLGLSKMTGHSVDELIGMDGLLLIAEKSRSIVLNNILSGYEKPYEAFGLRKNGEEFPIRLEAWNIPYKGKNARVVEFRDITEQTRMYDALREREEKFRLAFHTSPDSINLNLFDDGTYVDINEGFTKIMGYSREDVIGKSSISLNIWRDIKDRELLLSDLEKYGFVENLEAEFIKKDGQTVTGLMSARLLRIDNKKTIISITRDITEKKKAEKNLIDRESRYRELVENIAEEVWETDIDDKYTYMSSGCISIYGLTPEDILGKTPFDLMPDGEAERVRAIFNKIKEARKPFYNLENIIRHADGRDIYVETTGVPFFDDRGNLMGYRGTDMDITERKQNELDIQTLVESTVGLYGDRLFNTVTAKFCAWLKCNCTIAGKVLNNTVESISTMLDGEYVKNYSFEIKGSPCERTLNEQYFECPEDVTALFPNDHALARMSASGYLGVTLEDINGKVIGVLCCISRGKINITRQTKNVMKIIAARLSSAIERDKIEQSRQLLEKKLNQAQRMEAMGTLAGGIAHDFNNILTPILGYTELMSNDITKDSLFHAYLNEIYAAATRAKSLVNQILTFARQEQSDVKLMKIQHIVKEVLKLIRSTVPSTINIIQDIRQDCGVIEADPTQIHQIVMNLATNAYHAMEETGGTMTISLQEVEMDEQNVFDLNIEKGIYACLKVADTGTGIPEHIKEKIFDPFFTTKDRGKGTGIGLSVVHGIVKSSGGAVRVWSEPGKGTEFNIYLPIVESYAKKEDIQIKRPRQGGSERILLVDDEIVIVRLYKDMLEGLGYKVTSHTSSIEAAEAFSLAPYNFDIVITDMSMPNMAGDKLALELIKMRSDIPVLLSTGFSTTISEEKALSIGIKGFLMKPVAIGDLDKKIREILDNKRQ